MTRFKSNTPLDVVVGHARQQHPLRSNRFSSCTTGQKPTESDAGRGARGPYYDRHRQGAAYLSNDLDASAQEIADLYRRRWAIELFFRWIKQTLKITRFVGTSENAISIQIAVALITFLLLRLAQATQKAIPSPIAFARLIRTISCTAERSIICSFRRLRSFKINDR